MTDRIPDRRLPLSRRELLRGLFLTGSASALAPLLAACDNSAPPLASGPGDGGHTGGISGELNIPPGPLSNIGPLGPPDADGIAVPEGFAVRAVANTGLPPALNGLYLWHIFPDGGATFARENGGWIYTSNSEVPAGVGGCGALVFDPDGTVVDAYSILSNTSSNCAGGKTPWNTWLSCEEDTNGRVWETDPYGAAGAVEKPALGTFAHEAACVDPSRRVLYLTEDEGNSRFYRWVANASDFSEGARRLALESGTLQVMNIAGFEDGAYPETEDLRRLRPVSWKDVVRPDEAQSTVRSDLEAAGQAVPGTQFKGGEGLWFHELPPAVRTVPAGGAAPTRGLVFWSTKGDNRIWVLDIENQLVEIIFDNSQIEPGFSDVDNVTVSPWGDIVVAEDLTETGRGIRLMLVIPNQGARVLVEVNQAGSELTGPAFSPDGSRLYFSSQRAPLLPGVNIGIPGVGSGAGATYELFIPPQFRGS